MHNFRYFIPRDRKTTLTVSPETKQAVNLFAMLKGYTVNEATFRAIRTGIYYELRPDQSRQRRRAEQKSHIVQALLGELAKKLNVTEEEAARMAIERGILL
jgi:hypothetical protein